MNSLDYGLGCNNKDLFHMLEAEEVEDLWPLSHQHMQRDQLSNEKFQKEVKGVELIHKNDRVLVPQGSRQRLLEWYHEKLCHPGSVQQERTMQSVLTWRIMQKDIEAQCKYCHVMIMEDESKKKIKK